MKQRFSFHTKLSGYFKRSLRPILSVFILLMVKNQGLAQNSVDLVIDPVTVEVNDVFTVDVKVDFGTGSLALVETYINFNPLDLEVQSVPTVPAGTQAGLPSESVSFTTVANMNSLGQIDYGRFTTQPIGSHLNADFTFITITFRALRVPPGGTTSLTFSSAIPRVTNAGEIGQTDALDASLPGVITISAVGCTTPTATISAPGGTTTCNSQPFNLTLNTATGTGPFDLTIEGPGGPATYNNIAVGGIITNFTPPVEHIFSPTPSTTTWEDAAGSFGVKFQSSVSGFIKGVRFFAPDEGAAAGVYTGQLWTETGTLLASGTFGAVIADGWNELLFSSPVLITANTPYVISYHTNNIKYAFTAGFTSPITNGSLTASNSVFMMGAAAAFPATSSTLNFWADVIFAPDSYEFDLTGITDNNGCTNTAAPGVPLQTLSVTSVDCNTLPVSLLNFSATPKDNTITLRWSTASEINNLGFEVQRSTSSNGGWSAISFVNGAGNSFSTRNYAYVDEKLSSNRYYYRLKQVDIDQRFEYSPVVSAIIDGLENFSLEQNYPNPFRNETVLRFTLPQKANVKLSLYDMHGRLVKQIVNETKDKGTHVVNFNGITLTSGLYYYKIQAGEFSAVKKMTIQ